MCEVGSRRSEVGGRIGLALIVAVLAAVGCGKKDAATAAAGAGEKVVASVNGEALLQKDVEKEIQIRMSALKGRVPEDQMDEARRRTEFMVVDQFIVRTLLLAEAEKKGITAPESEITAAIEKVKTNLPPGQTFEAIIASAPQGEAGLIDEITTGLKINKLLEKELKEKIEVTEDEITGFMAENVERLDRPERVHARHILIKTEPTDDEAAKTVKKEKLDAIHQQLVDGADFAALAKENSACPSAMKGGDLGFFARGRMAKPFEDAAFSQDVDAIGPVIETPFGYHIVQVLEKQEKGLATREEVRGMLKQRKQQTAVREYVQSLREGADIQLRGQPLPEQQPRTRQSK
jgi:peptidyl-prolyl cis-trans isomerase C